MWIAILALATYNIGQLFMVEQPHTKSSLKVWQLI